MDDDTISCPGWRVSLGDDVRLTDRSGRDARLPLRKVRAIVAILACTPSYRVPRHALIALLWSDRGPDQARASLRQCLFTLRVEAPELTDADNEWVWLRDGASALVNPGRNGDATLSGLARIDPAFDLWRAQLRTLPEELPSLSRAIAPSGISQLGRQRRRTLVASGTAIFLAATMVWLAPRRSTVAPSPTIIAVEPFGATPASGVATAIAERMGDDIRALLPTNRAIVRATVGAVPQQQAGRATADWVVSGHVDARGDAGKVHVQIETAEGREIWTWDRDAAPGRLAAFAAIAATRTAMTTGCALGGPSKHRDPDVLALLFTACDRLDFNADDYNHEASLVALQRLAQGAPSDALAQAYYGTGLAITAWEMPGPIATAQRAEAARRLNLARRLDPRVGEVWVGRFALVKGESAYAARLGMLALGLSIEPSNPVLNSIYGALLAVVGRTDEALVFERRAIAFAPAYLSPTQHAAEILSAIGRPREALSLLDTGDLRFPRNPRQATQRLDVLLASGDTKAARQLLDNAAEVPGFLEPASEAATRRVTYAMEQPHGPLADAMARQAIAVADAKPGLAPRAFEILNRLTRTDAARQLAGRHPLPPQVFFLASSRPVVLDRQFPALAKRAGLWDYWQKSGHWPDICRDPHLQWQCDTPVKSASIPG